MIYISCSPTPSLIGGPIPVDEASLMCNFIPIHGEHISVDKQTTNNLL